MWHSLVGAGVVAIVEEAALGLGVRRRCPLPRRRKKVGLVALDRGYPFWAASGVDSHHYLSLERRRGPDFPEVVRKGHPTVLVSQTGWRRGTRRH